jgi:hypothetical protein
VLETATARGDEEQRILSLKICDPAAGSGHFLLTAARRVAKRLAQVRTGDAEPAPEALRTALRDVISHCIYAVDVNPMAVELCKVSLWMEAVEPGKPLSFLDHHIKCGNSLMGATRELLGQGVPDEAFDPVTGDDRAVAREVKRRNKREREGQLKLPFPASAPQLGNLAEDYRLLTEMPEDTPEQQHAKQREYERLDAQMGYDNSGRLYSDAWCAAFFWPLDAGHEADAPTEGELRKLEQSPWSASIFLKQEVRRIAGEQRFYHWHLEFPDVFDGSADEGFDCVLGNPPWGQVELKEEEFFAARAPDVVAGGTGAERKRRIEALVETDPALYQLFVQTRLEFDRQRKFLQNSGRFPLTGRGRTNSYSVFAESDRALISPGGRTGIIVPTGIATDDTNKEFFGDVVSRRALVSLYDFENRHDIFPGVGHGRYKFSLITFTGDNRGPEQADLVCFALRAEDLLDTERHFTLSPSDFALINPNTRTLPIFRSRRDADLTRQMYQAVPVLVDESGPESASAWNAILRRGSVNMSTDEREFRTRAWLEGYDYEPDGLAIFRKPEAEPYWPLFEGSMFHQFDHRFATFENDSRADEPKAITAAQHADATCAPQGRYWLPESRVQEAAGWKRAWLIAFRDTARSTDERTLICAAAKRTCTSYTVRIIVPGEEYTREALCLLANLNSVVLDYLTRQKAGGLHIVFSVMEQLPILPPKTYDRHIHGERLTEWVTRRALELTYTSYDMASFARDLGFDIPPFRWDETRRAQLRGELDGLYAYLYGLLRDEFAYIVTTFPVLQKNEEREYGEYRTALLALAAYDALAPLMAGVPTGAG